MKKWVTIDAFMVAFLSAIAYGFGYSIPCMWDAPGWLCLVLSFAVGLPVEKLAENIIYSKFTQEKKSRKVIIFLAFIAVFVLGDIISLHYLDESLVGGLFEEFGYVILFVVIGFVISAVELYLRTKRVKEKYDDGDEGFYFSEEEKSYIEGLNERNKEVVGDYDKSLAVTVRTGTYVGDAQDGVISYRGIPYAQPPVGKLRWKAPQPLPNSSKVYEAKHFGPSSIQVAYEGNFLNSHMQSEDCLYLNVYTSENVSEKKKPVIVYFHGGDFSFGGASNPLWSTRNFAANNENVITVNCNYRLGILGYIDFSEVPGGEDYPDSNNLGLLDQIAVLEWVKENIEAFGGDSQQITVMGDGSGGASICLLAVCPRAKGLFNKAIVVSGNPMCVDSVWEAESEVASRLLQESSSSNMNDLLLLSEKELSKLTQKLKGYLETPRSDGKLLPTDVWKAYESGAAKDIEFILCASKDNANVYGASIGRGNFERNVTYTIDNIVKKQEPDFAKALREWIDSEIERIGKAKAEAAFINLWMDRFGILKLGKAMYAGGCSVNMLFWGADGVIKNLGSGSVSIISEILGNDEVMMVYGGVTKKNIREILQNLVSKYILGDELKLYTNEIEGIDEIKWDKFPNIIVIDNDSVSINTVDETLDDAKKILQIVEKE